ncbi:MAG: FAD-binding protein [candidate division Zixibacteria bacterium]|nr:FAD-binding protein [candidate division Zixibacteria bacterium]
MATGKSMFGDLFYSGPDEEILAAPEVNENYETNVSHLYVIGDLTGVPLLKNAVNMGQELIEKIGDELKAEEVDEDTYHLLIVGAGGAGLAAGLAAQEKGLKYIVLEQKKPGNTINNFFKGKEIYTEPKNMPNKSKLWVRDSRKEELLGHWEKIIDDADLNIKTGDQMKVTGIRRQNDGFIVETLKSEYRANRVVLAMGRSGNPRMLRVPGEGLDKVHHVLVDPEEYTGEKIAVVGAGDSALEAVIALAPHNDVCLVIRSGEITKAQKDNRDKVMQLVDSGKVEIFANSNAKEIRPYEIVIDVDGEERIIENDHVFSLIGAIPPDGFLKKMGIRKLGDWSFKKVLFLAGMTALVFFIYAWKAQKFWIFTPDSALYSWTSWRPSMWFGVLYSIVITGFGIKAIYRYRNDSYQVKRYIALILSQVILFWLIPEIIFQTLYPVHDGWRAYGLFYPAPLYVWNFWAPMNAHIFWFAWSILISVIGIPIVARIWGKKYCSYVCSCGGLAETLGDKYRVLSPRGRRARAWENLLTYFILLCVGTVVLFGLLDKNSGWWSFQALVIDFAIAGVIGIASYPFWGNRIWCRFGCPLAKLYYIFAKDNSDVKISSGQHCIRCTLCSKYCQMGIQVMEFAKRNQDFSNKNSSCIQCGICITVCPTRNLQHGDWSEEKWKEEIEKGPPINVV